MPAQQLEDLKPTKRFTGAPAKKVTSGKADDTKSSAAAD
jgi:hypothetical protein